MRPRGSLLAAISIVAAFSLMSSPDSARAKPAAAESREMIRLVNQVRARHGLPSLRASRSLVRSSRRHGRFMLAIDRFQHLATIRASRRFRGLGEILAYHWGWRRRTRATMDKWLRSSTHRTVILSRSFRYMGAARVKGHYGRSRASTWVLQVGR